MPITPTLIDSLPVNKTLRDDLVTGLEVRSFPNGRKAYYLYFRTKLGKARHPKIGDCKILTLAQARQIAKDMLLIVANGGDPIGERNGVKREPTVEDLFQHFWQGRAARLKGAAEYQRMWETIVKPAIGTLRCRSVLYEDMAALHSAFKGTPYQANRVNQMCSSMFNFAERPLQWRDLGSNPCRGIRRFPEQKRRRFATPAELGTIGEQLAASANSHPQQVAFLYLLLFTGARPAEIGKSKRKWLEPLADGAGALRLPDSKTGQRTVYVPPQAMAVIKGLPEYEDGSICGITSPKKLWLGIRKRAGCPDLRLYPDLRRSFASSAFANGESIDMVGALLGHASRQTTLVYARLVEDAAVAAVTTAGNRMATLLGGQNKPDVGASVADEGDGHTNLVVPVVAPSDRQIEQASHA